MAKLLILCGIIMLTSCGSDGCSGVDTSQAPTRITTSGDYATYYWGDTCSRTYKIR